MLFRKIKLDHEILENSIFPISDTEKIIPRLVRSFPAVAKSRLEMFGYLIGLREDRLTHLVIPRYILGVNSSRKYELMNIENSDSRTQVMLATNEDTGESGMLIMASPKETEPRFLKGNFTFIPHKLLILNRPIIDFIPAKQRARLFPKMNVQAIKEKHIARIVKNGRNQKRTCIQNEAQKWATINFLPEPLLNIDAFASTRRSCPLNRFLLETLKMNKFGRHLGESGKTYYGRVHIHYGYDFMELAQDPLIRALQFMDNKFFELMTPVDAMSMIDSDITAQKISEHRLQAEQILEGVIALDPRSLGIIGISYFDRGIFRKDKELKAFKKVAYESYNSRNIESNKKWFKYIRAAICSQRPDYASS